MREILVVNRGEMISLHSPLGLDLYLYGFSFRVMAHVLVYYFNPILGLLLNVVNSLLRHRGVPRIL